MKKLFVVLTVAGCFAANEDFAFEKCRAVPQGIAHEAAHKVGHCCVEDCFMCTLCCGEIFCAIGRWIKNLFFCGCFR